MTITYDFTVEDDILLVKVRGTCDTLEKVKAYGMAIMQACLEHGCRRVICDETDLKYQLSTIDIFEAARALAEQVPSTFKGALVTDPRQMAGATFWETVGVNRGLRARVFESYEDARRWIDE